MNNTITSSKSGLTTRLLRCIRLSSIQRRPRSAYSSMPGLKTCKYLSLNTLPSHRVHFVSCLHTGRTHLDKETVSPTAKSSTPSAQTVSTGDILNKANLQKLDHKDLAADKNLVSSVEMLMNSKHPDLEKSSSVPPELLFSLANTKQRTAQVTDFLQNYIIANISTFDFKFLVNLLSALLKNRCLTRQILIASADRICHFLEGDSKQLQNVNIGKLFWVYGKYHHYDQRLCESIPALLKKVEHFLNPWMVTNIAWYCARERYYDLSLMDTIAQYSLDHMHKFLLHDMSNLVYSFGSLNHPHPELMAAVASRLEREPNTKGNEQTYWMFVWASLVMDVHSPGVLSRVLNEEFIEASLKMPGYQLCLLQLSIALNYEHPELNLRAPKTKTGKWGDCFPSISKIDSEYMRESTMVRLERYRHSASMFSENIKRALRQIAGDYHYFNTESLSLSGYSLDFELLLNSKDKLIPIPRRWKMKQTRDVLSSIGVSKNDKKRDYLDTSALIDLMETAEETEQKPVDTFEIPSACDYRVQINLASDWGSKFELLKEKAARRIVIEGDGLPHFARNCDHVMGPTVLKHRQLRALGWEVVQVPYREWQHLKSGDEHAQYLAQKIFERNN